MAADFIPIVAAPSLIHGRIGDNAWLLTELGPLKINTNDCKAGTLVRVFARSVGSPHQMNGATGEYIRVACVIKCKMPWSRRCGFDRGISVWLQRCYVNNEMRLFCINVSGFYQHAIVLS